jgi:uncharacterized protein YjbI with pentapeptide repeats
MLKDAYLEDSNLKETLLQGADFRGAYLEGTLVNSKELGSARLCDTVMPDVRETKKDC